MGRTKDIELLEYFQEHKIVSLEDLKRILQTGARMTAFRAFRSEAHSSGIDEEGGDHSAQDGAKPSVYEYRKRQAAAAVVDT